jgi:hypothetical protein
MEMEITSKTEYRLVDQNRYVKNEPRPTCTSVYQFLVEEHQKEMKRELEYRKFLAGIR